MAAPMENDVDLGFVEKVENWRLLSHYFPSKVGGKPSWLSLKPLPASDQLKCQKCNKPCVFLCQIYAPDSNHTFSFHRTLFVFICKYPKCCVRNTSGNIRVFRSQLGCWANFTVQPPGGKQFLLEQAFSFSMGPWTRSVCGLWMPCSQEMCQVSSVSILQQRTSNYWLEKRTQRAMPNQNKTR